METKDIQMPVAGLNYSSLTQLLRNPLIFKMKMILGVYTGKRGVSNMIGSAGHEALKVYYGGNKDIATPANSLDAWEAGIEAGIKWIDEYPDEGIRYGKKGSREAIVQGFTKAMQIYQKEEPVYHEIAMCEEKMTGELKTNDGQILPLPASGQADIVHRQADGRVEIVDVKFVKSFTKYENEDGEPHEDYIKIIQAKFMLKLVKAYKNIDAYRVVFREVKYSMNEDGSPQIRDYVIPADHDPYEIMFNNLYADVVKFLSNPDVVFLPNLSDPFDGEEAGLMYAQGLISGDMSDVEVMHRVREVAFTSKKFVPSNLERAENENLLPDERVKLKLREFGILVQPEEAQVGANVVQYRFKLSAGTSMSKILKYKADIIQALRVKGEIRILAPIPGTGLLGIEVESETRTAQRLSEADLVMGTLTLPIGINVEGKVTKVPLNEMPHLLIAGTPGSGKSVLLHNILDALTRQMTPEEMHLTLIDPKRVELAAYGKKKHLDGGKVIFEYEDAVKALLELVEVMDNRYLVLEKAGKRDIDDYNKSKRDPTKRLPYCVVVVDEFADFMLRGKMNAKKWRKPSYESKTKPWLAREIEKRGLRIAGDDKSTMVQQLEDHDAKNVMMHDEADIEYLMVRLAQLGRAAGVHLVVATQRPSTDVITGLIKANFPTRIALTVASAVDSNVILGKPGAEKLAGKGDMLFVHPALKGEVRLQGFNLAK